LKGGVSSGRFDNSDLVNNDIVLVNVNEDYLLPNFGFGIYYQSTMLNTGLSVPLIMGYRAGQQGDIVPYHSFENYSACFTMQVNIFASPNWIIKPSTLVQYSKSSGLVIDAGAGVLYKNIINIGGSYRNKGAVIMLLSCKVSQQLGVGFAYDYGLKGINEYNRSSVEVNLEYRFGYKIKASNPTVF